MSGESSPRIDLREKGQPRGDEPQSLDRRLFVQLLAFGHCADAEEPARALRDSSVEAVLYRDLHDPRGIGLLTMSEQPEFFVTDLRDLLGSGPFRNLQPKPDLAMFGRTYSTGREPNLEDWMLHKTRRTVRDPGLRWAVWYPLRRKGEFARQSRDDQISMLREHGGLGRAYAESGLALDVRLACHGLDTNDNDFVIGLIGPELYPLSHLVQSMRRTRQTSLFIQQMGPFFVGHALYQAPVKAAAATPAAPSGSPGGRRPAPE
jgi:chlorite dismutase